MQQADHLPKQQTPIVPSSGNESMFGGSRFLNLFHFKFSRTDDSLGPSTQPILSFENDCRSAQHHPNDSSLRDHNDYPHGQCCRYQPRLR